LIFDEPSINLEMLDEKKPQFSKESERPQFFVKVSISPIENPKLSQSDLRKISI